MTRKEALTDLLAKVEAGESFPSVDDCAAQAFPPESAGGPCTFHLVSKAHQGSLDAAKALHEAVLPGWTWAEMRLSTRPKVALGFDTVVAEGQCPDLARAWLIAILKALIEKEGDT